MATLTGSESTVKDLQKELKSQIAENAETNTSSQSKIEQLNIELKSVQKQKKKAQNAKDKKNLGKQIVQKQEEIKTERLRLKLQKQTQKQYYGELKSEIIEFSVIPSDEHISKKLQIEEGSFVYHIIRKRVFDDKPYCLEITYMPISIIPNLKLEHLKGSIYQYIEKELKLKIQSTHKTIRAHLSSPLEQENLGLKEYEPYIEVEQTAYLSSGIIFEYSFTRYHYNNFEHQTVTVQ